MNGGVNLFFATLTRFTRRLREFGQVPQTRGGRHARPRRSSRSRPQVIAEGWPLEHASWLRTGAQAVVRRAVLARGSAGPAGEVLDAEGTDAALRATAGAAVGAARPDFAIAPGASVFRHTPAIVMYRSAARADLSTMSAEVVLRSHEARVRVGRSVGRTSVWQARQRKTAAVAVRRTAGGSDDRPHAPAGGTAVAAGARRTRFPVETARIRIGDAHRATAVGRQHPSEQLTGSHGVLDIPPSGPGFSPAA